MSVLAFNDGVTVTRAENSIMNASANENKKQTNREIAVFWFLCLVLSNSRNSAASANFLASSSAAELNNSNIDFSESAVRSLNNNSSALLRFVHELEQ